MTSLVLALVLAQAPAPTQPDPQAVDRARSALLPFKKQLKETLISAMKTSPVAAIDVCSKEAPAMARDASRDGVTVGRSAFRLRNPENAPRAWLEPVMRELAGSRPGVDASKAVALPGGKVGYAEAIFIQPACLTCHGEAIAPPIDAELAKRYPKDGARGFKEGEFRGVFWAEVEPRPRAP